MAFRIVSFHRLFVAALLLALPLGRLGAQPAEADLPGLTEEGRWREAEALARRQVELDTRDPVAWLDLGRVLFEEGRPERLNEAMDCLSRAVELDPLLADGWYWLGRASGQAAGSGGLLHRLGLARQTREAFTRSCELEPESFRYTYALMQFFLQAPSLAGGDRKRAGELASGYPDDLPAEKALLEASVSLAAGDLETTRGRLLAVGPFDDALVAQTWRMIAVQLAELYQRREEWDAAILTYGWVIDRFPDDPDGYRGRGRALTGAGQSEEARLNFQKAIELGSGG